MYELAAIVLARYQPHVRRDSDNRVTFSYLAVTPNTPISLALLRDSPCILCHRTCAPFGSSSRARLSSNCVYDDDEEERGAMNFSRVKQIDRTPIESADPSYRIPTLGCHFRTFIEPPRSRGTMTSSLCVRVYADAAIIPNVSAISPSSLVTLNWLTGGDLFFGLW